MYSFLLLLVLLFLFFSSPLTPPPPFPNRKKTHMRRVTHDSQKSWGKGQLPSYQCSFLYFSYLYFLVSVIERPLAVFFSEETIGIFIFFKWIKTIHTLNHSCKEACLESQFNSTSPNTKKSKGSFWKVIEEACRSEFEKWVETYEKWMETSRKKNE